MIGFELFQNRHEDNHVEGRFMKGFCTFLLASFDDDIENPQAEYLFFVLVLFSASLILAKLIEFFQRIFNEIMKGDHLQKGIGFFHIHDQLVLFLILLELGLKNYLIGGGEILFFFVLEPPK